MGKRRSRTQQTLAALLGGVGLAFCSVGCAVPEPVTRTAAAAPLARADPLPPRVVANSGVQQVRAQSDGVTNDVFANLKELTADAVIQQVLARNPTLAQMTAAWQAATERIPQAMSWDDPMFTGVVAPASIGSNMVEPGYRIEVAQKILFPGKRQLRGQAAAAEAHAAHSEIEDTRVQLVEGARLAFLDYYLATRALEVNEEGLNLLKEFQRDAATRYQNGQVTQQDVLQADVEIGRQKERHIILGRMHTVAQARINVLMHLPTTAPLPPPAEERWHEVSLPPLPALQCAALSQRPDLKALSDRIGAEEAALALAHRDYYPDVEAAAGYDTIMGNGPMRDLAPQVTVKVNLPVRLHKRQAAIAEGQAKIAQKQAELASKTDQARLQVQEAYEQLRESERILTLYTKDILPAASANVKAAQSAYQTGKVPFLSLIEAQRNVIGLRERYFEATADAFRRHANLERAVGGSVQPGQESGVRR